jgi:hypothetical protein
MSSLVIAGDTSGTITLQAPSVAGTTVLTLPTTSGTLAVGSAAMTLISTLTASSSSNLAWTGLSGYDRYIVFFENMLPSGNDNFAVQVGTGSTTYITSGYYGYGLTLNGTYGASAVAITNLAQFPLMRQSAITVNSSGEGISGSILFNGFSGSRDLAITAQTTSQLNGTTSYGSDINGGFAVGNTTAKTAIQLFFANGNNITSGKASLYGISS